MGVLALPSTNAWAGGRRKVPDLRKPRTEARALWKRVYNQIPLTIHIATEGGSAVITHRQVQIWAERANRALRPHGLEVEVRSIIMLPSGFSEVTRWQDRRRLAHRATHDGSVHVFVTESLDLSRPRVRRRIRGLHWRYRGLRRELKRREYVVVTRGAPDTTLAHEIGHLLGLRHSSGEEHIMCSCRSGPDTYFTTTQGNVMRQGAHRYVTRQHRARLQAARADTSYKDGRLAR